MKNKITRLASLLLLLSWSVASANVPGGGTGTGGNVTVTDNGGTVVLANGIVSLTINKSNGNITNFTYGGRNLLSGGNGGGSFYFDGSGGPTLNAPTYTLTVNPANNGGNQAEVFLQTIASPMDMGIYYDLLRGQQGVYDTFVLTHEAGYPAYAGAELRTNMYVGSIFDFLCVDPYRFRQMASPSDTTVAVTGAPKEVFQYTSGIYNGLTECKYAYSDPLGELNAYGWASSTTNFGVWQTFPSHEYLDGGPMHRELTEHLGNTLLDMVGGGHYGFGLSQNIPAGTFSSKTFGPAFIYANQYTGSSSDPVSLKARTLFADAQAQAAAEQSAWPYTWFNPQPVSGGSGTVYPQASGRGNVSGTFAINDTFNPGASPVSIWIGLAPVDGGNDFQAQYFTSQFWVQTTAGGSFRIPNVLPGTYNLWAFGPGAAGTFEQANVTVAAGQALNLGTVTWTPIRRGPTVWEIGIPNRNSNEFHNGEHDVTPYSGNLPWYAGGPPYNTPAAWGAFLSYATQFPGGVNYTVGASNYADNWNFCQPTTLNGTTYVGTSSKINFNLASAPTASQTARLYIAFACNSGAACILTVNGTVQTGTVMASTNGNYAATANPTTGFGLPDNNFDTMTRLGSQGTWGDAYLDFPATSLKAGTNTVNIGMRPTGGAGSGSGFEYDYVRMEMSGFSSSTSPTPTKTNTPIPPTSTFTFTPTRTYTAVPPTMTFTSTATSTATATRTNTSVPPTATFTLTPSFTATASFTSTRTNSPVPPTSTFTFTATNTATATRTSTPVPPTATNTPIPPTATFTNTAVPPTSTFTSTASFTSTKTNTPVPPTATLTNTAVPPTNTATSTRTNTLVPPTATNTMVPPTNTFTSTDTSTATFTRTNSPMPPTVTLTNTATAVPPTNTFTVIPPTATLTNTVVPPTSTFTTLPPTNTFTVAPPTATNTNTAVPPTNTATPAPPTATHTNSPVPPTASTTATPTSSPTLTATPSASPTNTFTSTPVPPTATSTFTAVPPTATHTNSPVPPTSTFTTVPPTVTFTNTVVPPTSTFTAAPPTATRTNTPVAPTFTFTNTSVPPTSTFTNTPVPPTATSTHTVVPPTNTPTFSNTPTWSNTPVPTNTFTPTRTLSPTTTPTPGTSAFVVQLLSGVTSDSTNSPHPQIQMVSTGSAPLTLNGITLRYWFNCDCTSQSLQAWVDWAGLIPSGSTVTSDVQVSVQPTALGGQTNYILYTFTGNLVLQPGQSIQIQSRFNKSDFSNMIQSNDWSYAANTSFTNQTKITGYQNGTLMWGQEPAALSSALMVSTVKVFPNPSTGTGTNLAFTLGTTTSGQTVSPGNQSPVLVDPNANITLKIYTSAFRMIWSQTLTGPSYGTSGEHSVPWEEKDQRGGPVANGIYLLRMTVDSQGHSSSALGKILILR